MTYPKNLLIGLLFCLAVSVVAFILSTRCTAAQNLTQATKMSEAIEVLASPSAVFAECYTKNSVAGAGGNVLNPICQRAYCLYERVFVEDLCRKFYAADIPKCRFQFLGKECDETR